MKERINVWKMYWLFLFYGFKASFVSFMTHVHKNRLYHQFNFNNII